MFKTGNCLWALSAKTPQLVRKFVNFYNLVCPRLVEHCPLIENVNAVNLIRKTISLRVGVL